MLKLIPVVAAVALIAAGCATTSPPVPDNNATSRLEQAIRNGDIHIVQLMTDEFTSLINTPLPSEGWSPLHAAIRYDQNTIISFLLERGADVSARDHYGWTPLHTAVAHGNTNAAAMLLHWGADIDARGGQGETPLHFAAGNNQHLMGRFLIESGASLNITDDLGRTPSDLRGWVTSFGGLTAGQLANIYDWNKVKTYQQYLDYQTMKGAHLVNSQSHELGAP